MIIEENVLLLQECVTSFNFYQIKTFPKIFFIINGWKRFQFVDKNIFGKISKYKTKISL